MANYKVHCKVDYHNLSVVEVCQFPLRVLKGFYDNVGYFPTHPLSNAEFKAVIKE